MSHHASAVQIHMESRTAQNSAVYLLPTLHTLSQANQDDTLTLLDVGCGPGTISTTLGSLFPKFHITAIDINPAVIQRAQYLVSSSTRPLPNITFLPDDITKTLRFAEATFDVTHAHQVLAHLPTPVHALREMLRVTKPGGVVALREGDYESECFWPELPGLIKFHDFVSKMMQARGGTTKAGRQLVSWALEAGVKREDVKLGFGTWVFAETEERKFWADAMIEQVRTGPLRRGGLLARLTNVGDLEEMARGWEEWALRDDATLGMLHGEILIRK